MLQKSGDLPEARKTWVAIKGIRRLGVTVLQYNILKKVDPKSGRVFRL